MGSIRGSAGSKAYTIPAKATDLRLRLALDDSSYASYVAVVETVEGRQIASQKVSRKIGLRLAIVRFFDELC